MDSNEILGTIREVTRFRNSPEYDALREHVPTLARLIMDINNLDKALSKGEVPLPVAWEAAYHATTDEMSRQEAEGLECEVCGRNDLATTVPPRCTRHVATT